MRSGQPKLKRLKFCYAGKLILEWDDPVRTCRHLCGSILKEQELTALCIMNDGTVKPDIYLPVILGSLKTTALTDICRAACGSKRIRAQLERVLRDVHCLGDLEEMQCNF